MVAVINQIAVELIRILSFNFAGRGIVRVPMLGISYHLLLGAGVEQNPTPPINGIV